MCLLHHVGGAFTRRPEELKDGLSAKAAELVKRAFDGLDYPLPAVNALIRTRPLAT